MEFFERLREERERLGFNQVEFGAIGGVKKLAQINYEKGEREPGAAYLAAIAAVGADVLYILTGQYVGEAKPSPPTSRDEEELLAMFRAVPFAGKAAAMGALKGALDAEKPPRKASGNITVGNMTNRAAGGVQVGYAGGGVSVKKGR